MAQKTAWTGAALTESDINTYLMHEGGAWTTYTPTLTQSVTVTKTVTRATYARIGRTIIVNLTLTCTGAGTAGNAVAVGLPVTAAAASNMACGSGTVFDSSAGLNYAGTAHLVSTTTVSFVPINGANYLGVSVFSAALASPDTVTMAVMYEAAT